MSKVEKVCVRECGFMPLQVSIKTVTFVIINNILSFVIISRYYSPVISF